MEYSEEQIKVMPAGRNLDFMVATALGWQCLYRRGRTMTGKIPYGPFGIHGSTRKVPTYSTAIAAAWEAIEALQSRGYCAQLITLGSDRVMAFVYPENGSRAGNIGEYASLALMRAALLALTAK